MALPDTDAAVQGLIDFVDASPSPFHAVLTAAGLLEADGYVEVDETEPFPTEPGRYYLVRGGSLVAWSTAGPAPSSGAVVPDRRRSHRQPEPADQAEPRPGPRRLAAAGRGVLRRPAARRPGWTATSACRDASRCAGRTVPRRGCSSPTSRSCASPSWPSTSASRPRRR